VNQKGINRVVSILKKEIRQWKVPAVGVIAQASRKPYLVLVSTLLSLRTKDQTTLAASNRLFSLATTPEAMVKISRQRIQDAIYPVGFYKTKARTLLRVSRELMARFGSKVPDRMEDLLSLKGVGRKTANLVLTLGFDRPGICVDVHVHRISNRLGFIRTRSPDESEMALRASLPKRHWKIYNDLLVTFGQNLCKPVSPHCSICKLAPFCEKVGVTRTR